jgi:hypothetical protein
MTSNYSNLLERILDLKSHGAAIDERLEALIVRGRFPSATAQAEWIALSKAPSVPIVAIQLYDPSVGGDITDADPFDPDRLIHVTLAKPQIDGVVLLFYQDSVSKALTRITPIRLVLIADLDDAANFRTRGVEFARWDLGTTPATVAQDCISVDPTQFVRDFVPDREVAPDLNPWLLLAPPAKESAAFKAWEHLSARRLLGSLVSRAWLEDGHVWLQASGPPIFRIRADDPQLPPNRGRLQEAALWVFLSGSDIEARHLIFATELGRAHRPDLRLDTTLDRALEAAKVTYEAHVQSSSRETLKALADLRKTVIEETQKIAQRAQDLTAGLWRDIAVSAAPFVLKLFGDAGKLPNQRLGAYFYFAAAGFIGLSFLLQCRINSRFFATQHSSRQRWMQTLYTYISAQERAEIAEKPIDESIDGYTETRNILFFVYAALVAVLINFGNAALEEQRTPSAPAVSTAPIGAVGPDASSAPRTQK